MTEAELCREVQCGWQQSTAVHPTVNSLWCHHGLLLQVTYYVDHVSSWQLSMGEIVQQGEASSLPKS